MTADAGRVDVRFSIANAEVVRQAHALSDNDPDDFYGHGTSWFTGHRKFNIIAGNQIFESVAGNVFVVYKDILADSGIDIAVTF